MTQDQVSQTQMLVDAGWRPDLSNKPVADGPAPRWFPPNTASVRFSFEEAVRQVLNRMETKLDLDRTDVYENLNVPDRDIAVCLRVIRTLRTLCLHDEFFDAEGAVLYSHVHAKIVGVVLKTQQLDKIMQDRKANEGGTNETETR